MPSRVEYTPEMELLSLPILLPSRRRLPWRPLAGALASLALLGGGWWWLRDSSLVAVRHVRIEGVQGPQAAQIETLLRTGARRMTTMDFDAGALRAAVVAFPVVERVQASMGFPHSARIRVVERPPVATLLAAGQRTALAGDGTALGAQLASSSLPVVHGSFSPVPGQRVSDASVLAAVRLLSAAPTPLARLVVRAFNGPKGLTVAMRNGLWVYFGDATRPHAKWLSLARVLADPGSAGARYVDVRVPERPAAGSSVEASSATSGSPGARPPVATLAERLEQATGAGAGAGGSSSAGAGAALASGGEAAQGGVEAEQRRGEGEQRSEGAASTPGGG
jgi:cell division protein FtsQ